MFYSELTESHISDEEYESAQKVWTLFDINTYVNWTNITGIRCTYTHYMVQSVTKIMNKESELNQPSTIQHLLKLLIVTVHFI